MIETPFKRRRLQMSEMRKSGMTLKAIGAEFGIGPQRVSQILAEENAAKLARERRQQRVDSIWKAAAMRVRLMEAGVPPAAAKTIVDVAFGERE